MISTFLRIVCQCLVLIFASSLSTYVHADELASQISFDQFIDKTNGDEVPMAEVQQHGAYRARRVYKSIFKWIDRKGYYFSFIKDFKEWCSVSNGVYLKDTDDNATCYADSAQKSALARYDIEVIRTASFQGDMTAGHATYYFYGKKELEAAAKERQKADAEKQVTAERAALNMRRRREADDNEQLRQYNCRSEITQAIQRNLKPGDNTNWGMIIELKPSLALVQNLAATPPTRWVRISEIGAPLSSDYCAK